MKALSFRTPWVATTVEKLLDLPVSTKRAIIRALERSIEPKKPGRKGLSDRFWSAYGAWDSSETAEELAKSIRDARYDRNRAVDL